jgi:uncharacterized protein YjbI with pentapeptide repeats
MAEKWKKWWNSIVIGLVIIGVLALLLFIVINRNEPWTGFGQQQITETSTRKEIGGGTEIVTETIKPVPAKNLWDWLDLFVVSFVVALALFWLNTSQKRREDKREIDREKKEAQRQIDNQHQATLLDYYDKMSELILKEHLGEMTEQQSEGDDPQDTDSEGGHHNSKEAVIARARTLAVLRDLDPVRVSAVFRFLDEAQLVKTISLARGDLHEVDWNGADLRLANLNNSNLNNANLRKTNLNRGYLRFANLNGAQLSGAHLRNAHLCGAYMLKADLRKADLIKAYLIGADLRGARLIGADLSGAKMSEIDLRGAVLYGAILSAADLSAADLSRAKYSADTDWPDGFKPKEAGAILVEEEGDPIEDSDEEE